MEYLFAAFLLVVVILELYDLNLKRKLLLSKWQSIVITILSSAILSLLFILLGWWASRLLPNYSETIRVFIAIALLCLLTFYGFRRDRSYKAAGNLVYASFGMFMLIALGKSILHMIIGLIIGMMDANVLWFIKSYLFGVIVFGVALFFSRKPFVRVLGMSLHLMKFLLYSISAALLMVQLFR